MKLLSLSLLLLIFTACDSNPLGDTKISSCDHSPNFKTGLPANCQVNFKNLENLGVWLDANDSGTLTVPNQTDVESWSDKSGNGALFQPVSTFSVLVKKQVNNRAAIRWVNSGALYSSSALTGFGADQDFTIAITLRTSAEPVEKFRLDNGAGNGFEAFISPTGVLSFKLSAAATPTESITLLNGALSKFIMAYSSSRNELLIYNDSELISVNTVAGGSEAWGTLRLSGASGLEVNEVIVYNSFKSEADIIEIQTYLNNKWGF